jgi:hypothetical protein
VFLPRQFSNAHNVEAHEQATGPEIWSQLAFRGMVPDAFVAGVGTGGTLMGVGRYLRGMMPRVRLFPVEPASSPTLSTGHCVGRHRIQGMSDEFIPPILDLDYLDGRVDGGDAILMAQRLAGRSAWRWASPRVISWRARPWTSGDAVVVTVFPDDNRSTQHGPDARSRRAAGISFNVELRAFVRERAICRDPEVRRRRPAGRGGAGRADTSLPQAVAEAGSGGLPDRGVHAPCPSRLFAEERSRRVACSLVRHGPGTRHPGGRTRRAGRRSGEAGGPSSRGPAPGVLGVRPGPRRPGAAAAEGPVEVPLRRPVVQHLLRTPAPRRGYAGRGCNGCARNGVSCARSRRWVRLSRPAGT